MRENCPLRVKIALVWACDVSIFPSKRAGIADAKEKEDSREKCNLMKLPGEYTREAFTLIDLLAFIACLAVLAVIVLPELARHRRSGTAINCHKGAVP